MPLVISLEDLTGEHRAWVGGKATNLAAMLRRGLPVPGGFCVTTAAFRLWLQRDGSARPGLERLDQLEAAETAETRQVAAGVRHLLAELPLPEPVERAVVAAWERHGPHRLWAVRSSATVEDLPEASFAGQHDSFLEVRGRAALLAAVRQCYLSLFADRAILYRRRQDMRTEAAAMAVVVQQMVTADTAGVLFTVDPVTGSTGRMVIEAARGLGHAVVSGHLTPERVVLDKATLRVIRWPFHRPGSPSGPDQTGPAPPPVGTRPEPPCVPDALARRLGRLARQAEQLFGGPQDLEWAVADGRVFLLQSRPITALPPACSWADRQVWSNLNSGEVFPDVITPITWTVIQHLLRSLFRPTFRLLGVDSSRSSIIGLVGGRLYFNANTVVAAVRPFAFALAKVPNAAWALGEGQMLFFDEDSPRFAEEDLPDLGFRWPRYVLSWPRLVYDLITHSPGRGDAWCERLKARNSELALTDLRASSPLELAHTFTTLLEKGFEGWDLLYLVTQAMALPLFQKACHDWLQDHDLALGYRLFAGLGGMPEAEAGLALWRLAQLAHAHAPTEAALHGPEPWSAIRARLTLTQPGQQFLAAWDSFMFEHGHHCRGELELFNPRWSETPDYLLGLVRGYLRGLGQSDPLEKQRRLAQEREELTAQCAQRLKNPLQRWLFLKTLRRAQKLALNREEWKNQAVRHLTLLRRVLLALGERLQQEGLLTQAEDAFFLEFAELEPVCSGRARFDPKAVVKQRRAEYERNLLLTPPPLVVGQFDPSTSAAPPPLAAGDRVLYGIPVFPGAVTGPARVILRADDQAQVLPGEILVAPFTDPAWTPYFVTAAGVVMDQGGILSHGSIVAREYGLPAVTNTGSATRLIRTGDLVRVDGTRGQVTVVKAGSE